MSNLKYIGGLEGDKLLQGAVVIYGCGRVGKRLYATIKEKHKDADIKCFCDKNAVENQSFDDIKVVTVLEAVQLYPNANFVVAGEYMAEMAKTLFDDNVSNIHIIFV